MNLHLYGKSKCFFKCISKATRLNLKLYNSVQQRAQDIKEDEGIPCDSVPHCPLNYTFTTCLTLKLSVSRGKSCSAFHQQVATIPQGAFLSSHTAHNALLIQQECQKRVV